MALVNDTTGTQMALGHSDPDCYVGIILGESTRIILYTFMLLSFVPPLEFVFVISFYFYLRLSVHVDLLLCSAILGKPYKAL